MIYEIRTSLMFQIAAKNYEEHACHLSLQQEILHLISSDSDCLPRLLRSGFNIPEPHQYQDQRAKGKNK